MALWSDATFNPITNNFNQGRMQAPIKGLIIHITDGASPSEGKPKAPPTLQGVWGWFCNPAAKASANFCVAKDGETWQFIDTANRAWSVDGDTIDAQWISIENIALPGEQLTNEQLDKCAMLFSWLHRTNSGIPLTIASSANSGGLGYHSLFGKGHPGCPGSTVISQLSDIIELCSAAYW